MIIIEDKREGRIRRKAFVVRMIRKCERVGCSARL